MKQFLQNSKQKPGSLYTFPSFPALFCAHLKFLSLYHIEPRSTVDLSRPHFELLLKLDFRPPFRFGEGLNLEGILPNGRLPDLDADECPGFLR